MKDKPQKIATTGIIEHNGKILIAKRKKKFKQWEFPGGKVEAGETPEECLIREIKEELDIDVGIKRSMGLVLGAYREKHMEVYAYVLEILGGEPTPNVHKKIKWVPSHKIARYDFVEEDIPVWRRYQLLQSYLSAYTSQPKIKPLAVLA